MMHIICELSLQAIVKNKYFFYVLFPPQTKWHVSVPLIALLSPLQTTQCRIHGVFDSVEPQWAPKKWAQKNEKRHFKKVQSLPNKKIFNLT